jgi:hypothetical protein
MNEVMMDTQDAGFALTPEQQRALEQLSGTVTCGEALRWVSVIIDGDFDPQRLHGAFDTLAAQQPMLLARLVKVAGFHGLRQVAQAGRFPLTINPSEQPAEEVQAQINETLGQAFVVGESAGVQAVLYRLAPRQWQLLLGIARYSADAPSMDLLLGQVRQAYAGQVSEDEAPGEFAQYLEWRSEVVLDEDAATARTYWQQHLQGLQTQIDTPWLAARRAGSGTADARVSLALEPARRDALQRLADELGQSLSTLLQGAWWLLLGRLSGSDQALVGIRHDSRGDYDYFANAIGVFEKTLPLCVPLSPSAPFSEWLGALATRLEAHRTWQEYWVPELAPDAAHPAYGFAVARASFVHSDGGLKWTGSSLVQTDPLELLLKVQLDDAQQLVAIDLHYADARYSQAAASAVLEQYDMLLASIAADAQTPLALLDLLGRSEEQRLRAINPPMQALADNRYLPQRIADLALRTPDIIALTDAHQSLSYGQLNAEVERVALGIQDQGLGEGSIVALALPRSAELVIAMLASWRIGAAYLPLDTQWPQARQALMVEQAGAAVVLTDAAHLPAWQDQPYTALVLAGLSPANATLPALAAACE